MTDLSELVHDRAAEKIAAGKRPSRADLEWLEATQGRAPSESSVELSRNAKGEMQFTVKAYDADPLEAERLCKEIANRLRATYPMSDGTVGSPMREQVPPEPKTAPEARAALRAGAGL